MIYLVIKAVINYNTVVVKYLKKLIKKLNNFRLQNKTVFYQVRKNFGKENLALNTKIQYP